MEPGEIEMDALESCDSADSEPDMAKTESFITPNTGILTNEDVCSSETLQASGFCNDVENLDCNIMINDNDRLYLQNDEHFQEANAVALEENTIEETQSDPTDGSFEQSLEEEYVVQSENGVDWNTATMYLMTDDAGETNDTVMVSTCIMDLSYLMYYQIKLIPKNVWVINLLKKLSFCK